MPKERQRNPKGTQKEPQRNAKGTPKECQRNGKGMPKECQRNAKGMSLKSRWVYEIGYSRSGIWDCVYEIRLRIWDQVY